LRELSKQLRSFDYIIFREEEESICLILPHTDYEQAEEICKRTQEHLQKNTFYISLIKKKETLSFYWGVSVYPEDTTLKDSLLENCNYALEKGMEKNQSITLYKNIH
jgi:GGDEF domain-containing protein